MLLVEHLGNQREIAKSRQHSTDQNSVFFVFTFSTFNKVLILYFVYFNKQERLQCFCNRPAEPSEEYSQQLCTEFSPHYKC